MPQTINAWSGGRLDGGKRREGGECGWAREKEKNAGWIGDSTNQQNKEPEKNGEE